MKRSAGFEIKNLDKNIEQYIISDLKEKHGIVISQIQCKVIHYLIDNLKNNKIVYQRDIEKKLNIKRSTVSGIINTMEKNQIIKRIPSKEDSRLKKIVLTKKFIETAEKIKKETIEFDNMLIKGISYDELTIFFKVLDKMNENINLRRNKK